MVVRQGPDRGGQGCQRLGRIIGIAQENIGSADEARDKFRPRLLINLLGRAYLLGASVVHYDDEVGSRHRFGLVVRHVNRGVFVGVVQTADLFTWRDRLSLDRFHPGDEGYTLIARRIADAF